MIYLDHNSTTNLNPRVIENISRFTNVALNPSSIHSDGRNARKILEESREIIAESVGAKLGRGEYKLIFTSGATEANNLIINNFQDKVVLYSSIEHLSVYEPAKLIKNSYQINCTNEGLVDLVNLEELLQKHQGQKILVSIMAANNETGVIQPIKIISNLCKKYNAFLHVDAVQALGKIEFDISDLDLDFVTLSAHKIGGIAGVGALILRDDFQIKPTIVGGGQEKSERSGTENVIGAQLFAIAAKYSKENLKHYVNHTKKLRDQIEIEIEKEEKAKILCKNSPRLPNTSIISMDGISSDIQLIRFDNKNIAVSNGSACSSGKVKDSHVLSSMGINEDVRKTVIRISLGINNTHEDAIKFVEAWKLIAKGN
jgi:cysteine desulfurase